MRGRCLFRVRILLCVPPIGCDKLSEHVPSHIPSKQVAKPPARVRNSSRRPRLGNSSKRRKISCAWCNGAAKVKHPRAAKSRITVREHPHTSDCPQCSHAHKAISQKWGRSNSNTSAAFEAVPPLSPLFPAKTRWACLQSLMSFASYGFSLAFAANRIRVHVSAEMIHAATSRSEIVYAAANCFTGYCYFINRTTHRARR
jgi:hypothetical protein